MIRSFQFGGTLVETLQKAFPELDLKPWKFLHSPKGFWEDKKNQRSFLDDLVKNLNLKKYENYYRITKKDVEENGGGTELIVHCNT